VKVCGGLLLQSGEPLLLQGDLGRLWFETYIQPHAGSPILLQNGTPLLQQCDSEGALLLQYTIPAPPAVVVPSSPLQASSYTLGGALVKWDNVPAFTEKHWPNLAEASGVFVIEFAIVAEPDVIRAGRASFVIEPGFAPANPTRWLTAEATIVHETRFDASGYAVARETLQQESEAEEEAAFLRLFS
jgi:hypothetical protein